MLPRLVLIFAHLLICLFAYIHLDPMEFRHGLMKLLRVLEKPHVEFRLLRVDTGLDDVKPLFT